VFHELPEVGVITADAASTVDFVFHRLELTWLEAADSGHIHVSGSEQTAVHISVDGFLTDAELIRVVDDDMVNGLTALDQGETN
jgi:hypothetical protein